MNTKQSFFVFMVGLVVTLFGVGGIENSMTDSELGLGVLVSMVGLLIMWVGTLAIQQADFYDEWLDKR